MYADQRPPAHPEQPIPIYSNGYSPDGVVLRPGVEGLIVCGTEHDTGQGACKLPLCPSVPLAGDRYNPWRDGRDGCERSWRPGDFGVFLKRSSTWQKEVQANGRQMDYNEIVLSGQVWNAQLPRTIEAFFGGAKARQQRQSFLEAFPEVRPEDVPLLTFNPSDWAEPFRPAER